MTGATSRIDRFKGEQEQRRLIEPLRNQLVIVGDEGLAAAIAAKAELIEVPITEHVIRQGDGRNELYFILAGSFRVFLNGCEVATRAAGVHVARWP